MMFSSTILKTNKLYINIHNANLKYLKIVISIELIFFYNFFKENFFLIKTLLYFFIIFLRKIFF